MNAPGSGRKWPVKRPREFQNLNQAPRDCTLYFDHTFLCRGSGRKYGLYDGRMYGSTVFHQARSKTNYLYQQGGIFKEGWGREISTCEESKNSQRMSKPSPCRNVPDGSDISMFSAAVCVGASTIATGDWSLWENTNTGFRHR